MSLFYAGIGSRKTPYNVCIVFTTIGAELALAGYGLRSGHAKGADDAFESGCDIYKGKKEIYLPWKGFNGSDSELYNISKEATDLAEKFHTHWENLSEGGKALQSRNTYQVLGESLEEPIDFVICWTEDGKGGGGTGQAIRLAEAYSIPIFDAGRFANIENMEKGLRVFLKQHMRVINS